MSERAPVSEIAPPGGRAERARHSRVAAGLLRQLRGLSRILLYPSGAAGLVVVLLFIALAALAPDRPSSPVPGCVPEPQR